MAYWMGIATALLFGGPAAVLLTGKAPLAGDWRTATHDPTGLAPDPAAVREAVVQVYAARAFAWRGAFGVHTWVAVKPADTDSYTRYEVIGWNAYRGGSAVSVGNHRAPDAQWYGADPHVIAEHRGATAEAIIALLPAAVASYPYPDRYSVWPGPNSNTFTAHLGRQIPELRLDLPPTAIGKDYLTNGGIFASAPSGTGFQVSAFGLIGLLAGVEEGVEINLLGLVVGIDPLGPALKLPGFGRIGGSP